MAWLRKLIIVTLSFFLLSSCDFITNQDITITQSTESGAIYLINIDNLTIKESSEENSPFHVLNSEYLLLYSEERGTFSLEMTNLGGGSYSVSKLGYLDDDLVIDESSEYFEPYYENGVHVGRIRNEFYLIDTATLDDIDLSYAIISGSLSGGGGGSCSDDMKVILDKEDFIPKHGHRNAVFDLSGRDYVIVQSQLIIKKSNKPYSKRISISNPTDLTANQKLDITKQNEVFMIQQEGLGSEEYVLSITPANGYSRNDFHIINDKANPRYSDGKRRPYLFPINYENNSIIVYVGEIREDFIFDSQIKEVKGESAGTIELLPIDEIDMNGTGCIRPIVYSDTPKNGIIAEFDIVSGQTNIVPVIFDLADESYLSDITLLFSCTDECTMGEEISMVVLSHPEDGIGYSRRSAYKDEQVIIAPGKIIEYIYFRINNSDGEDHHIKLWYSSDRPPVEEPDTPEDKPEEKPESQEEVYKSILPFLNAVNIALYNVNGTTVIANPDGTYTLNDLRIGYDLAAFSGDVAVDENGKIISADMKREPSTHFILETNEDSSVSISINDKKYENIDSSLLPRRATEKEDLIIRLANKAIASYISDMDMPTEAMEVTNVEGKNATVSATGTIEPYYEYQEEGESIRLQSYDYSAIVTLEKEIPEGIGIDYIVNDSDDNPNPVAEGITRGLLSVIYENTPYECEVFSTDNYKTRETNTVYVLNGQRVMIYPSI